MKQAKDFSNPYISLTHLLKYSIVILLVISQSSCFQHYYQTNTKPRVDSIALKQFYAEKKYFILHCPDSVYALTDIQIDSDAISGNRNIWNEEYDRYLSPRVGKSNQIPKKDLEIAISQVHLYTSDKIEKTKRVNIPFSRIFRVDVYGEDKKATKDSKILSIGGIVFPVFLFGFFIVAASTTTYTVPL